VTVFSDHVASGVLTSQLRSERKQLEGNIERLWMQCIEAIRDKLATENKSRNLLDEVSVLEKDREDLSRRLNDEKEATAEAKTDVENARAEAKAAHKRATKLELEVKNMHAYPKKTKLATCAGVDRVYTLFVDVYRDLGAQTAPFYKSGGKVGTPFLGWLQEELESLPSIVTGLMSYASLVSFVEAANALAHEGCRHFEAFDQSNKDFNAGVF
jgi:hypothetical protein